MIKMMRQRKSARLLLYMPLAAMALFYLIPMYVMLVTGLKSFAENNGYHDIANLADALSGEAAKTRYLLTLS